MESPFEEWSREEKNEFARRKMEEMKLRNEQLRLRHAEVERDRKKAEAKNSSVTSSKSLPREKPVLDEEYEGNDFVPKPKVKEREWDKGKSYLNMEDWNPPKFNHQPAHWRNYSDKRFGKKEENWRVRSANTSKDPQGSSSRFRASGRAWSNRKFPETSNQLASNSRNDNVNTYSKQKGKGYSRGKSNFSTYRSFQNSKLGESRKKAYVDAGGSASQSPSDSEMDQMKQPAKIDNDRVWRMDGSNEVRHRRSRVEKWVKSISTADADEGDTLIDLNRQIEFRNRNWQEYDLGFVDDTSKEYYRHAPTFAVNNKKCDADNYAHTKHNYSQGRTNKSRGNDKKSYDKKKVFNDKDKLRQESDARDRVFNAKESDYSDYKQEKCGKISDSKSSDNSGIWEDDVDNVNRYIYGDDYWSKCNLPNHSLNPPFPHQVDRNSDLNDYDKSTMQKAFNKQWTNKSHSRNLSSSDYSGTYENVGVKKQSDRRSNMRRSESHTLRRNKWKTELKPSGSSAFEISDPLVENSCHEYDPSILVQIEQHTVKRTFFNNNFIPSDNIQCNSPIKYAYCSEKENETDINVSEYVQQDCVESCGWGDYDYADGYQTVENNDYPDCTLEYNYEDLERGHAYFDKLDISSSENDSEGQNIKDVIESETGNHDREPYKRDYLNSKYLEKVHAEKLDIFPFEDHPNNETIDVYIFNHNIVPPHANFTYSVSPLQVIEMSPEKCIEISSGQKFELSEKSVAMSSRLDIETSSGMDIKMSSGKDIKMLAGEGMETSDIQGSKTSAGHGIESSPGLSCKVQPGEVSEVELRAVSEMEPGTVLEAEPGKVTEADTGKVLEEEPEKVVEADSGVVVEAEVREVSEAEPRKAAELGEVFELVPVKVSTAEPGKISKEVSGSVPREALEVNPGVESEPHLGLVSELTPEQVAEPSLELGAKPFPGLVAEPFPELGAETSPCLGSVPSSKQCTESPVSKGLLYNPISELSHQNLGITCPEKCISSHNSNIQVTSEDVIKNAVGKNFLQKEPGEDLETIPFKLDFRSTSGSSTAELPLNGQTDITNSTESVS